MPPIRFDHVPPQEPRLLEGLRLFEAGAYFESHEAWESLWHEVGGPERELLQGLIQLAAARHHLRQGNRSGAAYLCRRAQLHLAPWLPARAGLPIAELLASAERDCQVAPRRC